eukprot:s1130_g13.t1
MQALTSGHLTIDLSEAPADAKYHRSFFSEAPHDVSQNDAVMSVEVPSTAEHVHEHSINMFSSCSASQFGVFDEQKDLSQRLQHLSEKLKAFRVAETSADVISTSMTSPEDDPRHHHYPCFGVHAEGKLRTNQYASWTNCKRCGFRLSYTLKDKGHDGQSRQIGPKPA